MSRRNLLLCFDAFGTLFKPRRPISEQYAEVARAAGLHHITEDAVKDTFKSAFKQESKVNPNYGKANGMNAEQWWSNIIRNTFTPLLGPEDSLPKDLIPKLLHRFWSREGYELLPNVSPVLRGARNLESLTYERVAIGVITNSDDRVPAILQSLGLKVDSLRYGGQQSSKAGQRSSFDIDLAIMSYDVGVEKPDQKIFHAAEKLSGAEDKADRWDKVYVGDEYSKDVVGANNAGWNAVLISDSKIDETDVAWCEEQKPGPLMELFRTSNAVGLKSLTRFAEWLR